MERAEAEFQAAESVEFIHVSQYEPPSPQRRRRRRGRPTQYDNVDLFDDDSEAHQQRTVNTGGRPVQYDNSEASQQPPVPFESRPRKLRAAEEEGKLPRTYMVARDGITYVKYYRLPPLRTEENRCPY